MIFAEASAHTFQQPLQFLYELINIQIHTCTQNLPDLKAEKQSSGLPSLMALIPQDSGTGLVKSTSGVCSLSPVALCVKHLRLPCKAVSRCHAGRGSRVLSSMKPQASTPNQGRDMEGRAGVRWCSVNVSLILIQWETEMREKPANK